MPRCLLCYMHKGMFLIISFILLGGVFISSERFMNVENDPKAYFILISVILLLLVCSVTRNGLSGIIEALQSPEMGIGITAICLILSTYGLLQFFGIVPSRNPTFPITGKYENPAGFAAIQAAMFPFAFSICMKKEARHWVRWYTGIASLLCFLTVVLSGSRAGVLSLCTAMVIVTAFRINLLSFFKKRRWLLIPFIVGAVMICVGMYHIKSDSANGRMFVWQICMDLIKGHPLFGWGPGGFVKHYMDTQAAYFSMHPDSPYVMLADNVTHPFNEYIKLTVNFGLVGLVASFSVLAIIVKRFLKLRDDIKVTGLAVVTSVFVMCQFSYPFHYAAVWFIMAIAILPALFKERKENDGIEILNASRCLLPMLFSVLLVVVLRMSYLDLKWAAISKRSLAGYTERMLPYYESMKQPMRHNPLFLYNYAAELNYIGRYEESLTITEECIQGWKDYDVQILLADNLEKTGQFEEAINAYHHASNMIPCRFEPLENMMRLYWIHGDTLRAQKKAEEIIYKPVKISSYRVRRIKDHAQQLRSLESNMQINE